MVYCSSEQHMKPWASILILADKHVQIKNDILQGSCSLVGSGPILASSLRQIPCHRSYITKIERWHLERITKLLTWLEPTGSKFQSSSQLAHAHGTSIISRIRLIYSDSIYLRLRSFSQLQVRDCMCCCGMVSNHEHAELASNFEKVAQQWQNLS